MPRYLIRHPESPRPMDRNPKSDARLLDHLVSEIETGYAAKSPQEGVWREVTRQLAGIPETPVRNQPIPNAPNIEFPLASIIGDSLYAQATDTLFSATPILTIRENDAEWTQHAMDLQKFVNWMAANEIGLRFAVDTSAQDNIQMGTGVYYIPWTEEEQNSKVHRVVYRAPRIIPIAPQDFLVPGGSRGDHQQDAWCALRFWYTKGELESQARSQKWDISQCKPVAGQDTTRTYYEQVHHTSSTAGQQERYQPHVVWTYFDYFEDGIDRDLMVTFDRSSKALMRVEYNRYDTRPIESMRYQIRPHLFWGLGVGEMVMPFQRTASDILNHYLLNMMLVNGRMYVSQRGAVDDFQRVWPMRIVETENPDAIKELRMGDVYPSALMGLQQVIQAAERRVGVSGDLTSGNAGPRIMGTRTPGITAMTAMQQVNRRFAPAFDGIRLNSAAAVEQCLWRYSERVRAGGASEKQVEVHLTRILGASCALRVMELFKLDDFNRAVAVEFTAVSASINREADRQNAMLLMQAQGAYFREIKETVAALAQPGVPSIVFQAAKKIMGVSNFTMQQFLRSFDQVRNPDRMVVDLTTELDQMEENAAEEEEVNSVLGQVMSAVGAGGGGDTPVGGILPTGGGESVS